MKFTIAKNPHKDSRTFVELCLWREDLSELFQNGMMEVDVPDTETGEVKLTLTLKLLGEFSPRITR